MVLLCGLLHLFLFVSNAKADPDSSGLVKRDNDAFIYEPPLTQVENASKRNCHKQPVTVLASSWEPSASMPMNPTVDGFRQPTAGASSSTGLRRWS